MSNSCTVWLKRPEIAADIPKPLL